MAEAQPEKIAVEYGEGLPEARCRRSSCRTDIVGVNPQPGNQPQEAAEPESEKRLVPSEGPHQPGDQGRTQCQPRARAAIH